MAHPRPSPAIFCVYLGCGARLRNPGDARCATCGRAQCKATEIQGSYESLSPQQQSYANPFASFSRDTTRPTPQLVQASDLSSRYFAPRQWPSQPQTWRAQNQPMYNRERTLVSPYLRQLSLQDHMSVAVGGDDYGPPEFSSSLSMSGYPQVCGPDPQSPEHQFDDATYYDLPPESSCDVSRGFTGSNPWSPLVERDQVEYGCDIVQSRVPAGLYANVQHGAQFNVEHHGQDDTSMSLLAAPFQPQAQIHTPAIVKSFRRQQQQYSRSVAVDESASNPVDTPEVRKLREELAVAREINKLQAELKERQATAKPSAEEQLLPTKQLFTQGTGVAS